MPLLAHIFNKIQYFDNDEISKRINKDLIFNNIYLLRLMLKRSLRFAQFKIIERAQRL